MHNRLQHSVSNLIELCKIFVHAYKLIRNAYNFILISHTHVLGETRHLVCEEGKNSTSQQHSLVHVLYVSAVVEDTLSLSEISNITI